MLEYKLAVQWLTLHISVYCQVQVNILPFSQTEYKVLLCVSVTLHWMYFVLVFGVGDGVLCIVHSILKSSQGISRGRRDEREGERGANQEKLRSLEPRGWGSGGSMCLHEVASESGEEGGGRREEGGGRREKGGGRREEGGTCTCHM